MKLTIGIPTFNGGTNLINAIRSCSSIKLKPDEYEILVLDNNSDDESIECIEKLNLSNLRIVKNSINIGRIQNWNKCVDLLEASILFFCLATINYTKKIIFLIY